MLAFVFLIGLPIVELLLLMQAGIAFGFWPTVAALFLSAALGIYLIRQQGRTAILSAQQDRAAGEVPIDAILTGVRLAIAGVLLLIPGFITDALGLLLLIPGISTKVIAAGQWSGTFRFAERRTYRSGHGGTTIDAEYEIVSDPKPPAQHTSGRPPTATGSGAGSEPPRIDNRERRNG
jgi:UPF0716 protein FxsA